MTEYAAEYEQVVSRLLSPERFRHVLAVRQCAVEMAVRFGADPQEAALAGLLHDYARELPHRELLRIAREEGLVTDPVELQALVLLHGPVGAVRVRRELGIDNPRVLQAISLHTLGCPEMGLLDRIIYLADLVAEGRDYPGVDTMRQAVRNGLHQGLLAGFAFSVRYCLEREKLIHPRTIAAWNSLLQPKEDTA
jgi:predicted HD superfamily hydrolase involved in NAD metabolism